MKEKRIRFTPNKNYFQRYSESIMLPKIIKLKSNLYVAYFKIMKLLPAKIIIEEALRREEIKEGSTIIETSSGTFALGLGIICAELSLPFCVFSDPAISKVLSQRIQDLGGKVYFSSHTDVSGSYQKQRMRALENYLSENKLSYWTKQYDNLDNSRAYKTVADSLLKIFGITRINLVGTVGSGGSTGGIISGIREKTMSSTLIGVDTFNSVLFGQPDGKRVLRGLGNSIMPKNLNHQLYDEVHWISANYAFHYTRKLHREFGLYCGPTTGAAYLVASYLAQFNKNENYIFIAPDEGYRYETTVYNDRWLNRHYKVRFPPISCPLEVQFPYEAKEPWSFINWGRRQYKEVIGNDFAQTS